MPRNYFITGMPKTGKTTVVKGVVARLQKRGLRVGGFTSPEKKEHGMRVGFDVKDIETGRTETLASIKPAGPKVSKYYVKTKSFESVALPTMKNVDMYDVYVIDEIGRMERKSSKFIDLLDKIFESHTPVIASVSNEFAGAYETTGEILTLTQTNREAVLLDLINKTTETYKKKKAKRAPAKPKKARKPGKTKKPKKAKKTREAKTKKKTKKKIKKKAVSRKKKRKGIVHRIRRLLPF